MGVMNLTSDIVLYSIGCPKCEVLQTKLDRAGIKYRKVTDKWEIARKGFNLMPILEVDGKSMEFGDAVKWVNNLLQ